MVNEIHFTPLRPIEPPGPSPSGAKPAVGESSFKDILTDALKEIDGLQHRASDSIKASFHPTDPMPLHQVMIAVEEANIAFQFAVQVRNRLVDAYNELQRMQV